jgi:hypothetical protein
MEMMAKNIGMSSQATYTSTPPTKVIRMYNNSQGKCIVYQFDSASLKGKIYDPTLIAGLPNCSTLPVIDDVIIASGVDGDFYVTPTVTTGSPKRIGKATIRIKIGTGSSTQYLQTTVSFRDYGEVFY